MFSETLKRRLAAQRAQDQLIDRGAGPKERRELDNLLAEIERGNAILEYIAACDYPEVFEDEEEVIENE